MLTIVIIAVIVIVAVAVLVVGRGRIRDGGGRGLKHRFGPEYDRAVADHNGDTKAAERELGERVKQHGSLTEQPLSLEARAQYTAQWAGIQEQFVDSPQKAVTEADTLLAHLAKDRGFPGEQFEEQFAALSVHHADQVRGYRSMHTAARGQSGTEEMREAMVEARSLFEALVTEQPADPDQDSPQTPQSPDDRGHAPWALNRRHAKGSST
ncbi:hypothetical protein [Streptomyces ureilyticus]|uniref:Secreted protein n=1 Tax=Streptomyces ureilyticus TaxID=1775131 RepID=A0ABX0DJ61_9ACTN|nr:hypothetical protein [Streptomyces ureilyticus]NGO41876.1 hypothetical protein [Streptomyces ureilyticus]